MSSKIQYYTSGFVREMNGQIEFSLPTQFPVGTIIHDLENENSVIIPRGTHLYRLTRISNTHLMLECITDTSEWSVEKIKRIRTPNLKAHIYVKCLKENENSKWISVHREDGPAVHIVTDKASGSWWVKHAELHRDNGPALSITRLPSNKKHPNVYELGWFQYGHLHRDQKAALILKNNFSNFDHGVYGTEYHWHNQGTPYMSLTFNTNRFGDKLGDGLYSYRGRKFTMKHLLDWIKKNQIDYRGGNDDEDHLFTREMFDSDADYLLFMIDFLKQKP